jgi:transmembrane sensor
MSKVNNEALEWVVRRASRAPDGEEQAAFEAWMNAHPSHPGAYLRAQAIELALGKLALDEDLRPSQETLHTGLEATAYRHAYGRRNFLVAAAAGVAAIGVGLSLRGMKAGEVLNTAKGEFRKVPLADTSTVTLNGATRLEVRLGANERRLALTQGEAWFQVAKDKSRPFVVEAGAVSVRAVGTAFSVRRFAQGADVVVTEGVVEVWTDRAGARTRRMSAGDQAYVPDSAADIAIRREPAEVERKLAWRDGLLVFQDDPLAVAIAEFNRYNARTVVLNDPGLRDRKIVGQYRIDQPERFADDVHALLGVPVVVGADRIEIGTPRR